MADFYAACDCTTPPLPWPRFTPPIIQKWAGDISYIRTREGWPYPPALLDLYSCRLIGWALLMHANMHCRAMDDTATKLIYLATRSFEKTGRAVREWVAARNQFAILYPERFNK